MSEIHIPPEETAKTQDVELLDFGQASKMTKGFMFYILYEGTTPPFDRQLMY